MLTTRKNYNLKHDYKKQTLSDEFLGRIFPKYRKFLLLIRYEMHHFHFPHLNLLTLSSIQRQAYILDVHVRSVTSETFYSVKISVTRVTQLRRLVVGITGLLQCTPLLPLAPNSLTVRILNTAVVFSSKSRSGYVMNPDLLSEVVFCGLCGFVFKDKRRKKKQR